MKQKNKIVFIFLIINSLFAYAEKKQNDKLLNRMHRKSINRKKNYPFQLPEQTKTTLQELIALQNQKFLTKEITTKISQVSHDVAQLPTEEQESIKKLVIHKNTITQSAQNFTFQQALFIHIYLQNLKAEIDPSLCKFFYTLDKPTKEILLKYKREEIFEKK